MAFRVDQRLLVKACRILANRSKVYWIVGGSGAGKSTVCRAIAAEHGIPIYDMDAHVFDDYPHRCSKQRHPAISTWFEAPDSFAWMLELPEDDFLDFNRASNAEFLDLLADDLIGAAADEALLVDGWITNPSLLAQVVPTSQIVCLETAAPFSPQAWEDDPNRRLMRDMVWQLPRPEEAWRKFLDADSLMTRVLSEECKASGIRILRRDERTSISASRKQIAGLLGIDLPSHRLRQPRPERKDDGQS